VPRRVFRRQSGLKVKPARLLCYTCSLAIEAYVTTFQRNMQPMGGLWDRAVCVDGTYFTKRKTRGHGEDVFLGRLTEGHTTCVLGLVEINLVTRKTTGNVRLIVVARENTAATEAAIRGNVIAGTLVFTDKHGAYSWMEREGSGYILLCVNHSKRSLAES